MKINGERHYLWRAVDHEGEVLESFVTKTRDKKAALKFLKKSLKRHGRTEGVVTDHLRSYGAALNELGIRDLQETGRWANNRSKNSHQPFRRRERAMLRFKRMRTLQKFAAVHASVQSIRFDQAVFGAHLRSALTSAFAISIRFFITATMATLAGFPAVRRRSYFVLRSGLQRMATNAGI